MEEVQQMRTSEVNCWQCGTAVYKGAKVCPKCGAPSPAADIAKLRKVAPILLYVGMPVGIILLIVGCIMFLKGIAGFVDAIMLMAMGDASGAISMELGLFGWVILIAIGCIGVAIGPIVRLFLAKVDKATQQKQ